MSFPCCGRLGLLLVALMPVVTAQDGGETFTFAPAAPQGVTDAPIDFSVRVHRGTAHVPTLPEDLMVQVTPSAGVEVKPVWTYLRESDSWRWHYCFAASTPGAYSFQVRYRDGGFGALAVLVNPPANLPQTPMQPAIQLELYHHGDDGTVTALQPSTVLQVEGGQRLRFSAQGRDATGQVVVVKQSWRLIGDGLGSLRASPETGTTTLTVNPSPPGGVYSLVVEDAKDPGAAASISLLVASPPPVLPPPLPPDSIEGLLNRIEAHLRVLESLSRSWSWDSMAREAEAIMPLALQLKSKRPDLSWEFDAQAIYNDAKDLARSARDRDQEDVRDEISDLWEHYHEFR